MTRTQRNIAASWLPALGRISDVPRLRELRALDVARYLTDAERAEERRLRRGATGKQGGDI